MVSEKKPDQPKCKVEVIYVAAHTWRADCRVHGRLGPSRRIQRTAYRDAETHLNCLHPEWEHRFFRDGPLQGFMHRDLDDPRGPQHVAPGSYRSGPIPMNPGVWKRCP